MVVVFGVDMGRRMGLWLTALLVLLLMMFGNGCAAESGGGGGRTRLGGLTGVDEAVRDSSGGSGGGMERPLGGYVTRTGIDGKGVEARSVYAAAMVAPLRSVKYDGRVLPLVRPGGGYVAVQQDGATPWETMLGRPDAPPPVYTAIGIYRIEFDEERGRLELVEHARLEDVGVLGRNCDDRGFLIEAVQVDGSRWIGQVEWTTGEIRWILKGGSDVTVNAFAALSRDGRLAWCVRSGRRGAEDRFDLYVQSGNEIYTVPGEGCEWLFPTWANDGRSLFAYRLDDDGLLELVVMDTRSEAMLRRPSVAREIVTNGNRLVAYQCQAALQQAADPGIEPRLLFYHPGYDRMCMFDPRTVGLRGFTKMTVTAAWRDERTVVVGSREALMLEAADDQQALPAELAENSYAVRRTGDATHPFLLFAPVAGRRDELNIWVMDVITDPRKAELATVPLRGAGGGSRR